MPKKFILVLSLFLAATSDAIVFDRYHSQTEILDYLKAMEIQHPDLVRIEVIGKSLKGRDIPLVLVGKDHSGGLPAIYLNGTHHGNEKSSTETSLAVIDHLLENKGSAEIDQLLSQYLIIVQPIVNPDGHAANQREDSKGRDPNRDYEYPTMGASSAFQIPEIRLVRDVFSRFRVKAAVAYHSGMEAVLWPWCYSGSKVADEKLFYTLAKKSAEAMGFSNFRQSYFDYPTRGEFIDYAYQKYGTIGVTIELSNRGNPAPSDLDHVVRRGINGTLAFLSGVVLNDTKELPLESVPMLSRALPFNPIFMHLGKRVE